MTQRIVLAYSGGGRSSAAISWLAETYGAEVVALTLDIGQGGDLEAARDRALALGAVRAHVLDVRDEFARRYLVPALRAGVLFDDHGSRANVLSRPLIARTLVEIAGIEQTATVAHGSAADDRHIALAVRALSPDIEILGFEPGQPPPSPGWSGAAASRNGSRSAGECPDEPALVELTFSRGAPTAINGIVMPLVDLIGSLDILARAHGVGHTDRLVTPALLVLDAAHRHLQTWTVAGDADALSRDVSRRYADAVDDGLWFSPLCEALEADVESVQQRVNGAVRMKLFKGELVLVECRPAPVPDAPAVPAHTLTFVATTAKA
jgi:argininosuccinate synthase